MFEIERGFHVICYNSVPWHLVNINLSSKTKEHISPCICKRIIIINLKNDYRLKYIYILQVSFVQQSSVRSFKIKKKMQDVFQDQ